MIHQASKKIHKTTVKINVFILQCKEVVTKMSQTTKISSKMLGNRYSISACRNTFVSEFN